MVERNGSYSNEVAALPSIACWSVRGSRHWLLRLLNHGSMVVLMSEFQSDSGVAAATNGAAGIWGINQSAVPCLASVITKQAPPNMALQRTWQTVTLLAGASKAPICQAAELGC